MLFPFFFITKSRKLPTLEQKLSRLENSVKSGRFKPEKYLLGHSWFDLRLVADSGDKEDISLGFRLNVYDGSKLIRQYTWDKLSDSLSYCCNP